MKQKKIFILAAAALAFAACSSDESPTAPEEQQTGAAYTQGEVPVAFDAYVDRGTTRAGLTGTMENTAASIQTSGFGVFAYYTNADNYDQTFMPNFMYNQRVTKGTSAWEYTPIKYWPNEFGTNAQSDDADKVSFFAYAPYVTVNPTSGKVKKLAADTYVGENSGDATYGIVGMKRNNATGDPMVKYNATFYTDQQVDLVWGVAGKDENVTWVTKKTSGDITFTKGLPWVNVEQPKASTGAGEQVKFQFLHGLASLNVTVDTKVDGDAVAALSEPAKTKVYIRSVTFEGFDIKGALNLNNTEATKAVWYNFNCEDELNNGAETTIKDGRKDGKEGITEATKEYAAINPIFVQSKVWGTTGESAGVTNTAGNLFCTSATPAGSPASGAPIYVIPNGDKLKVTIEYDVLTADPNLVGKLNDGETPGSVVKNVITRYISLASGTEGWGTVDGASSYVILQNGMAYTIQLHLGLNSVQFDADVTAWDTGSGQADLPHNTPAAP